MAFDPDSFLAQTTTPTAGFDPDKFLSETDQKSVGGFMKNLGHDVVDTVKGVGSLGAGLVTHPIDTVVNTATHLPKAVMNEGKRIGVGELLTGHPINAVQKLGGAMYEKPLTTTLDVLPAAGAIGKTLGLGGEAAKGMELASQASKAGEAGSLLSDVGQAAKAVAGTADDASRVAPIAGEALNVGDEAAGILKEAPTSPLEKPASYIPPNVGGVADDVLSHIGNKAKEAIKNPMDEVKDFLSKKYDTIAQKPGWPDTVSAYAKEHARNMALKTLGASPGQIRKIGQANAEALADMSLERGIVSPAVGSIGAKKMIEQSAESSGQALGAIRKIATQRGAIHDMDQVINEVKSRLDPIYNSPLKAGEKKVYARALAELKNTEPTAENVSKKVSELFSEAKKQDKLKQPSGAIADVARQVRNINDKLIHQKLSPQETQAYQDALHEYGAMTQMKEFMKRRNSMDSGGRLGPGSGISRMMLQKFLDSVGYRTEARVANKFSDLIKNNPEIAKSPKAMLGHYADEAVEAIDEMGNPE